MQTFGRLEHLDYFIMISPKDLQPSARIMQKIGKDEAVIVGRKGTYSIEGDQPVIMVYLQGGNF